MELTKEEQKKLLSIARNSIESYLKKGTVPERGLSPFSENGDRLLFHQKCGAFVTLHTKDGKLRGCIGHMESKEPLYKTIKDIAVSSAIADSRFSPLTLNELNDIIIEISVLSPLKKVSSIDEIELGKHGVLVKRGFNSGVFLPQVATETGWNLEEFLNNLCSHKAGFSEDAWKDKKTELYVFTAQIFSE